jgi:hypothetical protein
MFMVHSSFIEYQKKVKCLEERLKLKTRELQKLQILISPISMVHASCFNYENIKDKATLNDKKYRNNNKSKYDNEENTENIN